MEQGCWIIRQSGCEYRVETGQVYWIGPGTVHSVEPQDHDPCSYRVLCFFPTAEKQKKELPLPDAMHPAVGVCRQERLCAEFRKLLGDYAGQEDASHDRTGRLGQYLSQIMDVSGEPERRAARSLTGVDRVRRYLEEHFAGEVALAELSQLAGFSACYLNRIFTRELGMPPLEYQNGLRIQKARQLLENGTGAALAGCLAGFADQSHFCRAFKKRMGMTPGQYAEGVWRTK